MRSVRKAFDSAALVGFALAAGSPSGSVTSVDTEQPTETRTSQITGGGH